MELKVETRVDNDYLSVMNRFDEKLFLALNPPFPKVKLLTFDGCKKNDVVSLELNFILFKQRWTSVITYDELTDNAFIFIDEGTVLPFFLKSWKHEHSIIKVDSDSAIVRDKINFRSPWYLPEFLLYPSLLLQFKYRRPVYKKILGRSRE